jgi:hypothetical protein
MSHWITTTSGAIVDVTKARAISTYRQNTATNAYVVAEFSDESTYTLFTATFEDKDQAYEQCERYKAELLQYLQNPLLVINRQDEPCLLYDKDPPERRQTERVKLRGHKVPTPAQRLARFVAYTTIWVIIILAMVKLLWFAFPSGVMQ